MTGKGTLYERVVSGEHADFAIVRERREIPGLLPWVAYLGSQRAAVFRTHQEAISVVVDAIRWSAEKNPDRKVPR